MKIKDPKYEVTAVKPSQYPISTIPEIVFAGRSNVGKSSLINSLLNRKNLARTGNTPGKTRVINFYNIDDILYFVDIPGYGYAKVSKVEKEFWGKLANTYLTKRKQIKLIIIILDIRHKPSELDIMMYDWTVASGFDYLLVATKLDKIPKGSIKPALINISKVLSESEDLKVIPISSTKKTNIEKLWLEIDRRLDIKKT